MTAMRPETVSRWRGQPGRLEVWYATCSEPDGTGWWFHYERVAPAAEDGEAAAVQAYVHGWVACFPVDAAPVLERFGPYPDSTAGEGWLLSAAGTGVGDTHMTGRAGRLGWNVSLDSDAPALYTFPRWAWEREVLPGAQIVDTPAAAFDGTVSVDGSERPLRALGARAHIYSHGNAAEWTWLHADLGGGDLVEVVSAVSHLPLPARLRPLPLVRLRLGGRDQPRDPLLAGLRGRGTVALPDWRVQAAIGGRRRIRIQVRMDPSRCVQLEYPNPDGTSAYCTNSEGAYARVQLDLRVGGRWTSERDWVLDGTAHAEVGRAQPWPQVACVPFAHGV